MSSNYKRPGVNSQERSNWTSTHTTVNSNSGDWNTAFLEISGGEYTTADSTTVDYIPINYSVNTSDISGNLNGLDLKAENWNSAWSSVSGGFGELQNVINVAKNGNDATADGSIGAPYLTVKSAMDSITGNTNLNGYGVKVSPGVYQEDNPITLKAFTTLWGEAQFTTISAMNITQPILSGVAAASVKSIQLNGAISAQAIVMNDPGPIFITNVAVEDCYEGIHIDNPNAKVIIKQLVGATPSDIPIDNLIHCVSGTALCHDVTIPFEAHVNKMIYANSPAAIVYGDILSSFSPNVDNILTVTNSGRINWSNIKASGTPTNKMPVILNADGGILTLTDVNLSWATSAVAISNGGNAHIVALQTFNCDNTLILANDNEVNDLEVFGGRIVQSSNYDLYSNSTKNTIRFSGCIMDETKMFYDNSDIIGIHVSDREGDEGVSIKGELHVGTPEQPKESVFGEGDSYTREIRVWQYNEATTTFTNVTVSAASVADSTFTLPTTIDSAIYVASNIQRDGDYLKHFGVKPLTTNSLTYNNSAHVIEEEYWNGSAWVGFNTMTCGGNSPYQTYGNDIFTISGSQQIRYNQNIDSLWQSNSAVPDGDGIDRYWTRIRALSTLDTAVEIQQIKIHSNRFEINADGWIEYFGKARPISVLPIALSNVYSGTGGASVASVALAPSTNLDTSVTNNGINNGDQISMFSTIPFDMDTGVPLKLAFSYIPQNTGAGDITWNIDWVWTQESDVTTYSGGSTTPTRNERTVQLVSTGAPYGESSVTWNEVSLDVSEMRSRRGVNERPDTLWIRIQRASSDYSGIVALNTLNIQYAKWCEGGHF